MAAPWVVSIGQLGARDGSPTQARFGGSGTPTTSGTSVVRIRCEQGRLRAGRQLLTGWWGDPFPVA
jgi:hypothetical protein